MSFTYNFDTAPTLSTVRLLIADTVEASAIFTDEEINQILYITSSQALFVSSMANPMGNGTQVPPVPQVYSVYRAAAMLLKSIASNSARLSSITQLLDVHLSPQAAASALRAQADSYIEMEENSGQFAIAEWVNDAFSARQRIVKQLFRQYGGGW
jgi:hypothetical protein